MDWRKWPASVKFYVSAIVGGGVAVYLWALVQTFRISRTLTTDELVSLLGILLVAGLSARWVVRIPRTTNWMAVADCLIIAIVMIYGLAPGVVAHGLFHLISYRFAVDREPRYAINKIYEPVQLGFADGGADLPHGWEDVRRLFAIAGRAALLDALRADLREVPRLRVVPTATALEDECRSADVYCAAWEVGR